MTRLTQDLPPLVNLEALTGRSVLSTPELSATELEALLAAARWLERLDQAGRKLDLLSGELAYALFFDSSTRTRSAWAGAAARLGMHPVVVDGGATQVSHGETARETGAMLGMNAHALGIRHDLILHEGRRFLRQVKQGIDEYLERTGATRMVPVVNLQCDLDHPTQTLADLLWLRERCGGHLAGARIAVSWAYSPSYAKPLSVPQGLLLLLSRFGVHLTLAHPEGYPLLEECVEAARLNLEGSGGTFRLVHDMDEAFRGSHVVYPKSWGPLDLLEERSSAPDPEALAAIERRALERNAQHRAWICDERRMALTAGGEAAYLHCLPADIGAEVTPGVLERFRLDLARQAQKKLHVIMALLAAAKVQDLAGRLEALAR